MLHWALTSDPGDDISKHRLADPVWMCHTKHKHEEEIRAPCDSAGGTDGDNILGNWSNIEPDHNGILLQPPSKYVQLKCLCLSLTGSDYLVKHIPAELNIFVAIALTRVSTLRLQKQSFKRLTHALFNRTLSVQTITSFGFVVSKPWTHAGRSEDVLVLYAASLMSALLSLLLLQ